MKCTKLFWRILFCGLLLSLLALQQYLSLAASTWPAQGPRRLTAAAITRNPELHARYHHPFPASWLRAALCVHGGEGSWVANTGNGFYGGMQFDSGTWLRNGGARYAPTANLATPHEQLHIAYTTWQRRGWYPWPNTARACGLL